MDHTLYTGLAQQQQQQQLSQQQQPVIAQNIPPPTRPPPRQPAPSFESVTGSSGERFGDINTQCGVPNHKIRESTGLVVNGKAAAKGQVRL